MPVDQLHDGDDNDVGIAAQTVDSETFEQGPFNRLLTTGTTFAYPSDLVESEDTGDPGGGRYIAKGGDADLPMHFRYGANMLPEEAAFRDTWTTELTYTGGGALNDVKLDLAGTHADLSVGLQIVLPLGTLTALKGGAGRGLLILNELWATAANNQPMMVKDVHDNGATDLVDIYAGYTGGGALDTLGAPKTGEDSQVAVLHFGQYIKDRRCVPTRVYSVMVERCDLTADRKYRGLLGWVANDYTLDIPGEGAVMTTVTGVGRRWLQSQATPPNGEVAPAHFVDPTLSDLLVGSEDLEFLSLVTFPNNLVGTSVPINLGDRDVTNYTFNATGGTEAKKDILGMTGVLPKIGRMGFSWDLGYYLADDVTYNQLEDLGSSEFHQKAAMHVVFRDPAGNWKGLTSPRNEIGQTGGEGGTGDETGALAGTPELITPSHRRAILQQWIAF